MKADQILKNAKIFTANKNNLQATEESRHEALQISFGAQIPQRGLFEVGKDADFLVFDNDLLTAEHSGISHNNAGEVYICGKKMK